jgi:hypothetical protein
METTLSKDPPDDAGLCGLFPNSYTLMLVHKYVDAM